MNDSGDGGIYAELVRNRDLKESSTSPVYWSAVQNNGGGGQHRAGQRPATQQRQPGRAQADRDYPAVRRPGGYRQRRLLLVPVTADTTYHLSFFAKAGSGFAGPLTASLEKQQRPGLGQHHDPVHHQRLGPVQRHHHHAALDRPQPGQPAGHHDQQHRGRGQLGLVRRSSRCSRPLSTTLPNGLTHRPDAEAGRRCTPVTCVSRAATTWRARTLFHVPSTWKIHDRPGAGPARPLQQCLWGYGRRNGHGAARIPGDGSRNSWGAAHPGRVRPGTMLKTGRWCRRASCSPTCRTRWTRSSTRSGLTSSKYGAMRAADGHPAPFQPELCGDRERGLLRQLGQLQRLPVPDVLRRDQGRLPAAEDIATPPT